VFLPQSSDRRPLTRKPEWRKDGNLRTFKTYYGHHDIKVSVGESLLNQLKAAAAGVLAVSGNLLRAPPWRRMSGPTKMDWRFGCADSNPSWLDLQGENHAY